MVTCYSLVFGTVLNYSWAQKSWKCTIRRHPSTDNKLNQKYPIVIAYESPSTSYQFISVPGRIMAEKILNHQLPFFSEPNILVSWALPSLQCLAMWSCSSRVCLWKILNLEWAVPYPQEAAHNLSSTSSTAWPWMKVNVNFWLWKKCN